MYLGKFIIKNIPVEIINTAVGNITGEIAFNAESLCGRISEDSSQGNNVPISKIDSIINPDQKITYLKADIEGFEQEMLKGAEQTIKRNKPKIAITTYHKQNNPQEIIGIIKGFVPEYKFYIKGIFHEECKPVMIHFWVPNNEN